MSNNSSDKLFEFESLQSDITTIIYNWNQMTILYTGIPAVPGLRVR